MSDEVLSVRFSPDGKLLAVALLDATVKVFYQDTLKFFLSLYGHKVSPTLNVTAFTKFILSFSFPFSPWTSLTTRCIG